MSKIKNIISKFNRKQVFFALLCLFVVSFPITYNLNSRVIIALGLFFFLDKRANLKHKINLIKKHKLVFVMIGYFLIQCLGLIYTDDLKRGLDTVTRLLPLVVLPGVIIAEKLNKKDIDKLLNLTKFWMVLVMFYLSLYQFFIEERPISSTVHFAFETLGISQHYVAILLVVSIMIALHQIYNKENVIINTGSAIILVLFLFLFSSRTSIIFLLISVAIFFYKNFRHYKLKYKFTLLAGVFFVAILGFISSKELRKKTDILIKTTDFDIEIIKTKNSITFVKNTFEQRIMINYASLQIIKSNPVLGVGTGDYLNVLQDEYKKLNFIAGIKGRFNAHNQYFEDYIKVGILGFIGFLILIYALFKYSYKEKSFMFYCAFAISIVCLFESFLDRHHGTAFLGFFIPLFYKLDLIFNNDKPKIE